MGNPTNKDLLIGLVTSLDDDICRDVWNFIQDKQYSKSTKMVTFDNVELTEKQYSKLIYLWGKDKTSKCIELLSEWLKEKNITKKISHYRQIIGWVERKYYQLYPIKSDDKSLTYYINIDTVEKARQYIKKIPKELRAWDSEVKYLLNKYGSRVLPKEYIWRMK